MSKFFPSHNCYFLTHLWETNTRFTIQQWVKTLVRLWHDVRHAQLATRKKQRTSTALLPNYCTTVSQPALDSCIVTLMYFCMGDCRPMKGSYWHKMLYTTVILDYIKQSRETCVNVYGIRKPTVVWGTSQCWWAVTFKLPKQKCRFLFLCFHLVSVDSNAAISTNLQLYIHSSCCWESQNSKCVDFTLHMYPRYRATFLSDDEYSEICAYERWSPV